MKDYSDISHSLIVSQLLESLRTEASSFGGLSLLGLVFGLDLLELSDVLVEVGVLDESDEELSLLLLAILLAFHGDGLGLDLLEGGVVVSIKYHTISNRS